MSDMPISSLSPGGAAASTKSRAPDKVHAAAEQFEALLMGQILRSARQNNPGWGGEDPSGECATDYAEQQFSAVLARQGGLGLAAMIVKGLDRKPATAP